MKPSVDPETKGSGLPKSDKKRVLIVDDHAVVREGLAALLEEEDDLAVCGQSGSAQEALLAAREKNPDIVLLDIALPRSDGIELTKSLLAERPKLPIVVLSMYSDSLYAIRALRAGAKGY